MLTRLLAYKKTITVALITLALLLWGTSRLSSPLGSANEKNTTQSISIAKGAGASSVAAQLSEISKDSGGSLNAIEIQALAFITGRSSDLKAGDYDINPRNSLGSILSKIARGEVATTRVRIAEGKTWAQIKNDLLKADLQHDAQPLNVAQLAAALKINNVSAEGLFFPDTYQYRRGETETAVLARAAQTLQTRLNSAWAKRAPNLPYKTPYDALIMASIIEKETGTPTDRAMIASVFINRLNTRMRLQTDPSVIYGIGEAFNGDLTRADLQRDNSFNTYTRDGLTPTPIATASAAAIEAALHPANSTALYFVARGDGSSEFSNTLPQHNAAVVKYQIKPATAATPSSTDNK